jgi:hypothetical protein
VELRGSYSLAHWATVIGVLRTSEDAQPLADRLKGLREEELGRESIERVTRAPRWREAEALGRRFAAVQVAKARRGPKRSFVLGYIPGANAFVDAPPDPADTVRARA